MKRVDELYHFEKFWSIYVRQNRAISKWDESRTDMEVFIRRTIDKWFSGKCFQVQLERHKKHIPLPFEKPPKNYKIFTKYVYIITISFAFAPYHDLITIHFIEPHSETIQKVSYGLNDFYRIRLLENEEDFRILKKFYPIEVVEIKQPLYEFIKTNKGE